MSMIARLLLALATTAAVLFAAPVLVAGQQPKPAAPPSAADGTAVAPPADYVIGPEDVLGVVFWRDTDMSGDVTVRPDGLITLPLIGDIRVAGMKPDAVREVVRSAAEKFVNEPNVTVVVRQINSRKVFITGEVATPGAYPLVGPRTVMQLIALAGGLTEYADAKSIAVMRTERGQTQSHKFNYRDVARGKNLQQNLLLQPGDTVVVP